MDDRKKLADELELLVKTWQDAKWLKKWSTAYILAVKVWYHLDTITTALRDEKVSK